MDRYLNRKTFVTTLGAAGLGLGLTVAALGGMTGARAQDDSTPAAEDSRGSARIEEMHAELYAAFTAALGNELGSADAAQVDSSIRAALATVVDGFASDDLVTPGQATAVKALVETLEAPVGPGPMFMAGHGPGMFTHAIGSHGGFDEAEVAIAVSEGETPTEGPRAIAQRFYPDFTAALAAELGAGSADEVDGAIRLAMMSVIDGLESDDLPILIPTDALKAMVATAESPLGPGLLFGPHPGMMIRAFHGHAGDGHGFNGRMRGGDDGWFGERGERARAGFWPDAGDDSAANEEDNNEESS